MAYTLAAWMNEMFKNLLLPYVNQASFAAPSAVASQLCDYAQAHLAITVTLDLPVPVPHDWVGIPVDMSTRMREQAIATAEQIRARLVQEFAVLRLEPLEKCGERLGWVDWAHVPRSF